MRTAHMTLMLLSLICSSLKPKTQSKTDLDLNTVSPAHLYYALFMKDSPCGLPIMKTKV